MVNFLILAGGYGSFIATYLFNSDAKTLSVTAQSPTGVDPSWLALNPTNSSILYAVNEEVTVDPQNGAVQSFTIGEGGILSAPISTIDTGGGFPAYMAPLSNGQVAVMNYNSGNGLFIPTADVPEQFSTNSFGISFPAPVSHPHMVVEYGNELLIPDLGADKVWRLTQSQPGSQGSWQIQGSIEQPAGSGPRHIAVEGDILYTLHELSSTLASQRIPADPNAPTETISSLSIVPPNPPEGSKFGAAEILFPAPSQAFPGRFIYTSNRNLGTADERGDAITIFSATEQGELTLVTYVYTGLSQIRGMQFGGPNNEYLIAGGSDAGGVVMYERTDGGAGLTELARNTDIPTRTGFVWL